MKKEKTTQEQVTVNDKKPVVKENRPVKPQNQNNNGLTREDLPEATNENTGKTGSGQRQDSN